MPRKLAEIPEIIESVFDVENGNAWMSFSNGVSMIVEYGFGNCVFSLPITILGCHIEKFELTENNILVVRLREDSPAENKTIEIGKARYPDSVRCWVTRVNLLYP